MPKKHAVSGKFGNNADGGRAQASMRKFRKNSIYSQYCAMLILPSDSRCHFEPGINEISKCC